MDKEVSKRWVEANWFAPIPTVSRDNGTPRLCWGQNTQSWYLVPIEPPPLGSLEFLDRVYEPRCCIDSSGLQQENGSVAFFEDCQGNVVERHMWAADGRGGGFREAWHLALPQDDVEKIDKKLTDSSVTKEQRLNVKGRYRMATATAPRNAKNPSASSKAKTTKGKRAAKAKDTAAASRVSPDTVPEVDVRADETATPSAPTKGPETTPVVKHSRQAKFQILGHSASRVCRYMGLSGLSFDDAVAAIRGLGGDMPNPKTIQVEMADGRKPDRFPAAPLTDEQKAAVDAYKGKGSPVDREALLQEHLATKARVAA